MNLLLRHYLRVEVESDLPGRLRVCYPAYPKFPPEVKDYLHYVKEALMMPKGVTEVRLNERIGSILICYDPAKMSGERLLNWVRILTETGLSFASDENLRMTETEIERAARAILEKRVREI